MTWYYIDESITDGERRKGPYSIDEIKDFVKSGEIKNETLVWHSGMEAWVRWEETSESKEMGDSVIENAESDAEKLAEEEQIKAALEAILAEHKAQKRYAGFFIRGAAYFVDNIILSAFGIIIMMIMGQLQLIDVDTIANAFTTYASDPNNGENATKLLDAPGMNLFLGVWGFFQAIYFVVFTAIHSSTPGKRLFHLHVEVVGQEKVGWVASALRYVASLFTQFTFLFYGLGYLIVMVDPKRRALHDWIAKTRVVHEQRPATVSKKK
ncbi:MAG: RDD family protein [Fibrobacter sp.]|nr:RDD family protein [Fibrobacter sp.]